ncbi:MAG TPA: phospholipase D-like domain-containing protein [Chitinophagaceae bacterium]|nr:phospholipase D-like domain-containing protein [Chitinophagaceae bacterium]
MATATKREFQLTGANVSALFTLKLHRGEGMALIAMNWKNGKPTKDFVGFAIEYKEPGGTKFFALNNRLGFLNADGSVDPNKLSTLRSPIQKFRWVHFPRNADMPGNFTYRVSPVFMDPLEKLSYGDPQEVEVELMRETYPGKLNVTFTRGFVSSQAFVDKYQKDGHSISELMPVSANDGLTFVPTHPLAKDAYAWMGFEARSAILEVLDEAIKDKKAQVKVIAYDLNEPGIVTRLEKIGNRVQVIIDDDGAHGTVGSAENQSEERLVISAGRDNVKRQHMGKLQHNKTIVVDGPITKAVVCGSTNLSWRGFFIQSNNAMILRGEKPVKIFSSAFDNYWNNSNKPAAFGKTASAKWNSLGLDSINAKVAFSPHNDTNALLQAIGDDINNNTSSSLLYSLAFLYETKGPILDAINKISKSNKIFVYGISDKKVGGIDLHIPDTNIDPVFPVVLKDGSLPEPFKSEPVGGGGTRLHHKFAVIDFDKPTARVYLGSYNFSSPADIKNGENLLLIKDRRVVTAYMIEALRIFDHYHFRLLQADAATSQKKLFLHKPPTQPGEKTWFDEDYTLARKIRDREIFS